ncbi:MAG: amidohydrolase family protein [Candidatus Thorarchaeota archaeon]|nr:amidohydrolase family protein [Candidatus Thorarchaeota archaeon]
MSSIIVSNGTVVTPSSKGMKIIEDGAVAIEGSQIEGIGKTFEIESRFSPEIEIDATGKAILPGFVDAHIHTPLSLFRGLAQDVPESEWMTKAIDPLANKMTKKAAITGSKLTVIEGLKAGTTCFCDYATSMADLVKNVYLGAGVRANVCSTINEVGTEKEGKGILYPFDRARGEKRLKENIELVKKWQGAGNGRITCLFGPQAADMLSRDFLLQVRDAAIEYDLPIHMHVAQGQRERGQMMERYGKSTVNFLNEIGYLDDRLIAVHCHDTTKKELALLTKNNVRMVGCPGSIGMIDGIVPPLANFKRLGGVTGIGSDQCPPDGHNMFMEAKYASILSKTKHKDPTALPAWDALRMLTIGGARCHGLHRDIGSIEAGKKADLILIDIERANLVPIVKQPIRNIIPNLILHGKGSEVTTAIIDGKIVLQNGNTTTMDESTILKEAQKTASKLAEVAAEDFVKAGSELLTMKKIVSTSEE